MGQEALAEQVEGRVDLLGSVKKLGHGNLDIYIAFWCCRTGQIFDSKLQDSSFTWGFSEVFTF